MQWVGAKAIRQKTVQFGFKAVSEQPASGINTKSKKSQIGISLCAKTVA
jgi:hypothetical protein